MPDRIRITDVSPRDGLQNEAGVIATADKVRLVELLCAAGVDEVEVSSFVSPKWVPQLGDAAEVFAELAASGGGSSRPLFSALVPNEKGMLAALEVRQRTGLLDKVSVFTAASETFSRRNTNASIAETLERFKPVLAMARDAGLPVRGYVSCVIACPFEGPIPSARVARVCVQLAELGVDEIDLGDTIGAGDAASTRAMLGAVRAALAEASAAGSSGGKIDWWTRERLTLHLHDTFGRAAECVRAALDEGVRSFDSSVAGLGGCPYASTPPPHGKRAPGNISTQTLVSAVRSGGYACGVDDAELERVAAFASQIVSTSRAAAVGGEPGDEPRSDPSGGGSR